MDVHCIRIHVAGLMQNRTGDEIEEGLLRAIFTPTVPAGFGHVGMPDEERSLVFMLTPLLCLLRAYAVYLPGVRGSARLSPGYEMATTSCPRSAIASSICDWSGRGTAQCPSGS
jgi:hypothetical protein